MNINLIINFVTEVVRTLTDWQWSWCPVRVDNRFDRY